MIRVRLILNIPGEDPKIKETTLPCKPSVGDEIQFFPYEDPVKVSYVNFANTQGNFFFLVIGLNYD